MSKRWFGGAGVVLALVLVVFFAGYSFQGDFSVNSDLTGAIVTSSTGRQCNDGDNGGANEGEATTNIWLNGIVYTRDSSSSAWGVRNVVIDGASVSPRDVCLPGSGTLREFWCNSDASAANSGVQCAFGCSGGRCNPPPCTDSDGRDASVVGTTRGIPQIARSNSPSVEPAFLGLLSTQAQINAPRNYNDICVGVRVREYVCSQGVVASNLINCPSGQTCNGGRCVASAPAPSRETICDNLDDNRNGRIDEGCDDDGDDYCRVRRYSAGWFDYTVVGTPAVCPNGGGDCADGDRNVNPGMVENCFGYSDDNCDGQQDEGCAPYVCEENDVSDNPAVGGFVIISSENGQERIWADRCFGSNAINQTGCPSGILTGQSSAVYTPNTNCPAGTTCSDPDGAGPTPAVCS